MQMRMLGSKFMISNFRATAAAIRHNFSAENIVEEFK